MYIVQDNEADLNSLNEADVLKYFNSKPFVGYNQKYILSAVCSYYKNFDMQMHAYEFTRATGKLERILDSLIENGKLEKRLVMLNQASEPVPHYWKAA